jgi:hypothetical protein
MINAPVAAAPVSARWQPPAVAGAVGVFRASDLPVTDALWTAEIARPGPSGPPVTAILGLMSGLPLSTVAMPPDPLAAFGAVRVSDRGWIGEPDDPDAANEAWPARLIEPPALEMAIPVYPTETRRTEVAAGEILLANADGGLDALAGDWTLAGRSVVIRRGPHRRPHHARAAEIGRVAQMRVVSALSGTTRLRLTLATAARDLDVPVCDLFAGTGGPEGPAELAGQARPRLCGRRRNFAPVLIDPSLLIYHLNDGPLRDVAAVRNRAVPQSWAGNVGTYGELASLVIAGGTYWTCRATGHVRLGSPATVLTADAEGDVGGMSTAAAIALHLLRGPGGLDALRAPAEAFLGWPAGVCGLLLSGGTVADAMDRLSAGIQGWWGADAFGRLYGGLLLPPEDFGPSVTIQPWMLLAPPEEEAGVPAPWWRNRVSYRSLDRVQAGEDVAGVVPEEERLWLGRPATQVTAINAAAQSAFPASTGEAEVDSIFDGAADAQAMADRLLRLFSAPRRAWRVALRAGTAGLSPSMLVPGTIVSLPFPRIAALAAGRALVVRSLSARGDRLDLILWG